MQTINLKQYYPFCTELELMVQLVVSPKINDALSSCKTIGHHHVIMRS